MGAVFPIVFERLGQTISQRDFRRPTKHIVNLAEVTIIIADVDDVPVGREWDQLVMSAVI